MPAAARAWTGCSRSTAGRSSSARPAAISSASSSRARVVGRLAEVGWDRKIGGAIAAMLIGEVLIYAIGVPWLMAAARYDLGQALSVGLAPFIVPDLIKLVLAGAAFPTAWWILGRRPGER